MDLLGGYGSGSDSEPGSPPAVGSSGTVTVLASSPRRQPAVPAAAQRPSTNSHSLSSLPAPSGLQAPLFSGLPKPQQKKVVQVKFRMPISYDPADVQAADLDEEPARKRRKAASKGASLTELLPAPKNASLGAPAGGRRGGVLGGGEDGLGGGRGGKGLQLGDSDDEDFVPGAEDRSGMVDLKPGEMAADDNEAFRVSAAPNTGGTAALHPSQQYNAAVQAAQQYGDTQQQQYAAWQAYYAQHDGHGYNQHQQAAAAAAAAQALDPAEAMLQAALAAEREKASRRGQAGAVAGIEIKEVRGDQLKAMDPGQRAGVDAIRNALGADYEAKLRRDAGSDPTKLAKRRHQISSLYHYAKQKELEQLEVRAQGSKTKAETQKKYGW